MQTSLVIEIVRKAAPRMSALWANGLGYTSAGWEYSLDEKRDTLTWVACRGDKVGRGETPTAAREAAQPVA